MLRWILEPRGRLSEKQVDAEWARWYASTANLVLEFYHVYNQQKQNIMGLLFVIQ